MKEETYSTYDAKARFSEILRKIQRKKRVIITSRGKPVAEIIPYTRDKEAIDDRLSTLANEGIVEESAGSTDELRMIARRSGALARFLEERE